MMPRRMKDREELEQTMLAGIIEEAMEPLAWMLTDKGKEVFRKQLQDAFSTHPVAVELLEPLIPRKSTQRSGTLATHGDSEDSSEEKVS